MSDAKVGTCMNKKIDKADRVPDSETCVQKCFPKEVPKRGGGQMITNVLLLHDEETKDIKNEMKYSFDK